MRLASRSFVSLCALFLLIGGLAHCAASDASPPGYNGFGGFGAYGGDDASGPESGSGGTSGGSEAGSDVATGGSGGDSGLGGAGAGGVSGGAGASGSAGASGAGSSGNDAGAGYRHTITMDGVNDFNAANEAFTTTSASYQAFITWDANNLYVGYTGSDISAQSSTKWVFVYIDVDPGSNNGSSTGEKYNTEQPAFPSGFLADDYYAWRTDGLFPQFKRYTNSAWSPISSGSVMVQQNGTYVEIQIPFSSIGVSNPQKLGVVTLMMNEQTGAEGSYAGLYSNSFTDGKYASIPIQYYLAADLTSSAAPNDPANRKP